MSYKLLRWQRGRRSHDQHGGVMTEAAMATSIFIFMLLVVITLIHAFYLSALLHHTVVVTQRWAAMGMVLPDGSGGNLSREDSIEKYLNQVGNRFGFAFQDQDISICNLGNSSCTPLLDNAGASGDHFELTVSWPLRLFGGMSTILHVKSFARNEVRI